MKPSQNSLLKADTCIRSVAKGRILGLVHGYVAPALLRSVPILAEAAILAAGTARFKPQPVLITLSVANAGLALLYAGWSDAGQSSSPVLLFLGGVGVPTVSIGLIYGITRFSLLFKSG